MPRTTQKCTICGEPSIPGLVSGAGKCQYHWNVGQFGQAWADHVKNQGTINLRVDEKGRTMPNEPDPAALVRINLRVYVRDADGRVAYHNLHIGFFVEAIAPLVAASLNARSLAFHSYYDRQIGRVDVVLALMEGTGNDMRQSGPDIIAHAYDYGARGPDSET